MADRKPTVLNPAGYQENLQDTDNLVVEAAPTANNHAVNKKFIDDLKIEIDGDIAAAGKWEESGGKLYPKDLTNNVQVGGTSADPNISLNNDGSAAFASESITFFNNGGARFGGTNIELFDNGAAWVSGSTTRFRDDGDALIGTTDWTPTNANIYLKASDGSASFAGTVDVGSFESTGDIIANANVLIKGTDSNGLYIRNGADNAWNVQLRGNGTADFAGKIVAGENGVASGTPYFRWQELGGVTVNNPDPTAAVFQTYDGTAVSFTSQIFANGSATFAGTNLVGTTTNPTSGAAVGIGLQDYGAIHVCRSGDNDGIIAGYKQGKADPTSVITADGSATFDGDVVVGNDPTSSANNNGLMFRASGGVIARRANGTDNVFAGYLQGGVGLSSAILADGSAKFSSFVSVTRPVDLNPCFNTYKTGNANPTSQIFANGSATFSTISASDFNIGGITKDSYLRSDADDSASGNLTFNGRVNIRNHLDLSDDQNLDFGSSDDVSINYNSNNWLYCNFKTGNGILFQDNGSVVMALEDSGVFRPNSTNTGSIGSSSIYWANGYFADLTSSNAVYANGGVFIPDNQRLCLGTGNDIEHYWDGYNYLMNFKGAGDFYIRDGSTPRHTLFRNGDYTCTGNLTAGNFNIDALPALP